MFTNCSIEDLNHMPLDELESACVAGNFGVVIEDGRITDYVPCN